MNRLLIVAYYTPPLGLSGVMRVTKLCKYLPEFGWEPIILTVKPVAYYAYDPQLLEELKGVKIFRAESLDPNRLMRLMNRRPKTFRLRSRLRFLFFPDTKIGWFPFAVALGKKVIPGLNPQVIFATAPPWTALLVGLKLSCYFGLPFVCDFRDPWPTGFQPPPRWQRPLLARLGEKIIQQANLILAVNRGTAAQLSEFGIRNKKLRIEILENGFDPEGFSVQPEKLNGFSILYVGNLWQNRPEIERFLSALTKVPFAQFYLAGGVDQETGELLKTHPQVTLLGTRPHLQVLALMKGADALLYLGKPNQPVGLKLYEYLGAERPIIIWGKGHHEAIELTKMVNVGFVCDESESLARVLMEIRGKRAEGGGVVGLRSSVLKRFNRRFQAESLARRLNELLNR